MSYALLPQKVFLEGVEYEVVLDPNIKGDTARKTSEYQEDGEFDAAEQTIKLRPGMKLAYAQHVLCHEVSHAMWEHSGLTAAGGAVEAHEEVVVTAMARRLWSLIRDNPDLVDFIRSN